VPHRAARRRARRRETRRRGRTYVLLGTYVHLPPSLVLSLPRHLSLSSHLRPGRRFINLPCNSLIAKFRRRARMRKVAAIKGPREVDEVPIVGGSYYRFISTKTCTTLSNRSIHRRWWETARSSVEITSCEPRRGLDDPWDFSVRSGLLRSDSNSFKRSLCEYFGK